jgi:hypothetical protein
MDDLSAGFSSDAMYIERFSTIGQGVLLIEVRMRGYAD